MIKDAKWIGRDMGEICPEFIRRFLVKKPVKHAVMTVTATGVYEARINGERVGNFFLAPGCTAYQKRLQYQEYDITDMLFGENEIAIILGKGWHRSRISANDLQVNSTPGAVIAEIAVTYQDGESERIITDEAWTVRESPVRFSDIYDGEVCDNSRAYDEEKNVEILDISKDMLIPQEGEIVCAHERISPVKIFVTPKNERVLDFGQNLAGYVEIELDARAGDVIELSCAEILDSDGNFYTDNYRSAKSKYKYICGEGHQTCRPYFTFFGFRYIRLDSFPGEPDLKHIHAAAVYSDMRRTGFIECSDLRINKLFLNTLWSQRSNFIDIPTDCPQRDERMGWTGDAQVFALTAGYNYDVLKFFKKWLGDLRAEQRADGSVPSIIPNFWKKNITEDWGYSSTAWGEAAVVIPYQMYRLYGDKSILEESFESMKKWVEYMRNDSIDEYLWTYDTSDESKKEKHFGDWLGLDAPYGSYKGSSDPNFIASAFYAYSTSLLIKAGKAIGRDVSEYEELYGNIVKTFKERFHEYKTQTEYVLALYMGLANDTAAAGLDKMIRENGNKLQTGFVGTPYLLHALSGNGYTETAYSLLLQEEYPSWLYEVTHGATTIWEHWDGIRDDGTIWSADMNSYNHYAYGSVIDWIYTVAAGIRTDEEYPGFERAVIAPKPDRRVGSLKVSFDSRQGKITSAWTVEGDNVRYEITVPVRSKIIIDGNEHDVLPGSYVLWGKLA
ncbi:MAG: family 78 glycoside hydrolase catalytic domain [Clostridiales bacterium]|nr:family 78 glycoside hydrolase catalytic domain [Clostridiales bacterium]